MHPFLRYTLFVFETIVFGPAYAYLNQLVRVKEPLHAERAWSLITEPWHPSIEWFRKNYPPYFIRKILMWWMLRPKHDQGIENHYDVSNEFFESFLDKRFLFYSCADFLHPNDTLEDAQTRKANHLLGMLDPNPGEKILELGPGWGSMLRLVYSVTGDKQNLHSYTLSKKQIAFNRERENFNMEYRDFITTDYPNEFFDKIYSVAVSEHVRPQDIEPWMKKLAGAVKPGGRIVKHFFCLANDTTPVSAVAGQLIFPGSELSSHHRWCQAIEDAGLLIERHTVHDYRPTLKAWYFNLARNREQAIEAANVYQYNRFLVFIAGTYRFFDDGEAKVYRFKITKPIVNPSTPRVPVELDHES
ncbi:MAG: class I SAM-dependent methyltransferase [Planctomycetota bacterium]